ncbi:hypothetical protein GX50_08554 [[Emmonsia] crescens]|uniref:Uncharacterized protein n=1 Tax=[Emmonsia] crescens TaxID=73230 RepID=A0A2B7Z6D4_9EURO|nr:hypothetical protein GX50_08554 [Emmonsia crescens]
MSNSTSNESIHNGYGLRSKGPNIPPKLTAQQLFITTRRAIIEATDSKELVYENIDSTTGFDVDGDIAHSNHADSYLRHTPGMDCQLDSGYAGVGVVAFQNFQGPYAFSSKEPDLAILPDAQPLPTIVVESCWSESYPRLQQDMQLWLEGGAPTVQLVLLLEWSKSSATQVKGRIEVHGRNSAGTISLLQAENIFPISSESPQPTIAVTRGQLFGSAVFAGRDAFDSYPLSIANLRQLAAPLIQNMGYTLA